MRFPSVSSTEGRAFLREPSCPWWLSPYPPLAQNLVTTKDTKAHEGNQTTLLPLSLQGICSRGLRL
jgi:hypothetical protein